MPKRLYLFTEHFKCHRVCLKQTQSYLLCHHLSARFPLQDSSINEQHGSGPISNSMICLFSNISINSIKALAVVVGERIGTRVFFPGGEVLSITYMCL